MKCSLCSGMALFVVGKKGYCKAHKEQAVAESKKSNAIHQSARSADKFHYDTHSSVGKSARERYGR